MNISEQWSLPWHALQRRLAETSSGAPQVKYSTTRRSLRAAQTGSPAANWLVGARTSVLRARCSI